MTGENGSILQPHEICCDFNWSGEHEAQVQVCRATRKISDHLEFRLGSVLFVIYRNSHGYE